MTPCYSFLTGCLTPKSCRPCLSTRVEFAAHNQVTVFQDTVVAEKKSRLEALSKTDVLDAFTLDSPVPFSIEAVVAELSRLNQEMVQGARGERQGPFYGQFSPTACPSE